MITYIVKHFGGAEILKLKGIGQKYLLIYIYIDLQKRVLTWVVNIPVWSEVDWATTGMYVPVSAKHPRYSARLSTNIYINLQSRFVFWVLQFFDQWQH